MEGWQWYKHSGVQWSMATETSLFQTITIPTPNQKNLMVLDLLLRMVNVIGTKWKTCCGISIMHNWGVFLYVELMVMTYWFGILIQQVNLQWGRGIILQWQKMNQEVMVYNVVLLGSWRKCGIFGYQTESKFISGVCYSMRSQLVSICLKEELLKINVAHFVRLTTTTLFTFSGTVFSLERYENLLIYGTY